MTHYPLPTTRRKAHTTLLAILLLVAGLFATTAGASAQDQWIHVKVEGGHDGENVTVNLPLSLLSAAAAMIPQDALEEAYDDVEIELDELSMSWDDLQDLWDQVRDSPDATYVTVQSRDETVKVWKEGDFLKIATTEAGDRGTEVDVTFPLNVVDALFSGPGRRPDFQAALQALADHGPGNLVSIRDGEQTVRIWVDDRNESE